MAAAEIKSKEKWDNAHRAISHALEKEIKLMRELLSNLHQEELSLIESAPAKWHQVMKDRSDMIVQLKNLRDKRDTATTKLETLAKESGKTELLPVSESDSCEILSMLDQEVALLERINLQNCRNDVLFKETRREKPTPLHCPYPHPLHRARRKTSLATKNQG